MKNIKNRLTEKLIEKGWNKSNINKTLKIIERAKKNKHPKIKILDKFVYWYSLLLAIIGNLAISIALIPELLVLNSISLYVVIVTLGIAFGLLFELLIRSIELQAKHHVFLGIAIPLVAVINFILILGNMKKLVGFETQQNPLLVGIVYAISFILPYLIYQLFLKNK